MAPRRAPAAPAGRGSLSGLLASREIIVACGPGGVGKTTTAAAAAAMAAAHGGGKVLVLTIDPARRLANALGLDGIGNTERRVPDEAFASAGIKPRAPTAKPRFNRARRRITGSNVPHGPASHTRTWNELLPRSHTAARTGTLRP